MILTIILLAMTISLFLVSLVILGKTKLMHIKHRTDMESIQKVIDDNIKLSGQLYKLYAALQDSQSLQIKAFEVMSKNQKMTAADVVELRDQVSQALVAIIEQISGGTSNLEIMKFKDGKFKLN